MTRCDRTDCDIFNFLKPLEEALFDETCCHHEKIVFINQCMKYTNVSSSMLQLIKEENVKAVIEALRKQLQDKLIENQIKNLTIKNL